MEETEKNAERGGISVEIEHIFPIIKKWLYSEKEIFLRELVSNACDAVTKMKRLVSLGEATVADDETYAVHVTVDHGAKTLTVSDNGIGMSEEEVKKYICQIALSGALDFIEKYEGENASGDGIIGHFGLGFYSAFMVADRVEVVTKSFADAPAVHWECEESGSYEFLPDAERETRGSDVILHVTDDEAEFLNSEKLREILDKYCAFMPIPIYFHDAEAEEKAAEEKEAKEAKDKNEEEGKKDADADQDGEATPTEPQPINDTHPLWQKKPSDCTDAEYDAFYHKVFHDYREPLFHIHLSADYPLNFKGILYFPRLSHEYDSMEGQVKLFYNQVFVADNIKEVIPEFLLMLKGVLDCPELPLNVSRSYLQSNGYVTKISNHIVKKVADKINALFTTDREKFEGLWPDLCTFIEYGSLREHKFYDRVKDSVLFATTNKETRKYVTVTEYLEAAKEKHENTVYYTTDPAAQAQYVSMFETEGIELVVLPHMIDTQFINVIEQDRSGVKFVRIDADVASALCEGETEADNEAVTALFRRVSGSGEMKVSYRRLKDAKIPAVLNLSEESRRLADMMRLYKMGDGMPNTGDVSLILNSANPLIQSLMQNAEAPRAEKVAKQIYSLALLSQRTLTAEELQAFLLDSYSVLGEL